MSTNGTLKGGHSKRIIQLGVIGCGEIYQVSHASTLSFLSDFFKITYLCDVSEAALEYCKAKVAGSPPKVTTEAEDLCSSPEVDAVVVCNATAFHVTHALLALKHNKHVFVEKPLALCYRDVDALEAAEKQSQANLFVGYMRRYAPAFRDALAEVGSAPIRYARVRDIIGPNSVFVDQSGTFPKKFSGYRKENAEQMATLERDINQEALLRDYGVPFNPETAHMLGALGGLGSHDLSAMREALGMPRAVLGASLQFPIWSALFQYDGFSVVYESGLNSIPLFDAHIEIYTDEKIVRVNYDSPYVKGLPTTFTVREKVAGPAGDACYVLRHVRRTYEDSYTTEFKEWYDCITQRRKPKTDIADARQDLDIFKMLMQAAFSKGAA